MRRPSSYLKNQGSGEADQAMTPMIDVIFLLLVFFVCTASLQVIEEILPTQLSSAIGNQNQLQELPPEQQDFEQVVIRIGWENNQATFRINNAPVDSLEGVRSHLLALSQIKVDVPLVLHPDPPVPLGQVIAVYDESKLAGFPKVSFAVNSQN